MMSSRLLVLLLGLYAAVSANALQRPGLEGAAQQVTFTGRAGRTLLRQDAFVPQRWTELFRLRTVTPDAAAATSSEPAAETMLPPTITIPADLQLESAAVDPAMDPEKFVGLFKKVPHKGGPFLEAEAEAEAKAEAGAKAKADTPAGQQDTLSAEPSHSDSTSGSDVLESGQMLQKYQAEGLPVVHGGSSSSSTPAAASTTKDKPAPAADSSKPAPAPVLVPAPAAPTAPSNNSSSSSPNQQEAALPAKPAEVDVALIPTDPYASAAAIPVIPYTGGGGRYSDAAMQAFLNTAGGISAFREKHGKSEAAQQTGPKASSSISGGATAGLVIGLTVIAGCVAWYVIARYRKERRVPAAGGLRKQRPYSNSADAEIDVAGSDGDMLTPRSAFSSRSGGSAGPSSSSGFQPARAAGRFSAGAGTSRQ